MRGRIIRKMMQEAIPKTWVDIMAYIVVLGIIYGIMYTSNPFQISETDHDTAIVFLDANAGILVTIFTVTMGVTMLGIQFRAQSYTMLGLVQHIKDKVVYGFIATFLILITVSIAALIFPELIKPTHVAPHIAIGTFFSLLYLVGYVYYMTYKIQPDPVMRQIISDIDKIKTKDIINDKNADATHALDVWEQVMLGAVKNDNTRVFKTGIKSMLGEVICRMKSCKNKSEKEKILDYFYERIGSVVRACVRENRGRFVTHVVRYLYESDELTQDGALLQNVKLTLSTRIHGEIVWESYACENSKTMDSGWSLLESMMRKYMENELENNDAYGDVWKSFHIFLGRLAARPYSDVQLGFYEPYMRKWNTYRKQFKKIELLRTRQFDSLALWEKVMGHAVQHQANWMLGLGITNMCKAIQDEDDEQVRIKLEDALTRSVCGPWDEAHWVNYAMLFLDKLFMGDKHDRWPKSTWAHVMIHAVQKQNTVLVEHGLYGSRYLTNLEDRKFFWDELLPEMRKCIGRELSKNLVDDARERLIPIAMRNAT